MTKARTSFYFLLILITFWTCKKETVIVPPVSLDYFPVTTGSWREYEVDSIYHADNDNNNDDSVYVFHFYIREVIDSSFIDIEGRRIEKINRYRRNDTISEWQLSNVWTQRLSTIGAYRTEDNVVMHKLSFPINSSASWDANDSNTNDEETNYYEYFHEPGIFNYLNFDSTLSVIQVDENNYISRLFGNEIYATGVGLIYKERVELEKQNGVSVTGVEYRMTITGYN